MSYTSFPIETLEKNIYEYKSKIEEFEKTLKKSNSYPAKFLQSKDEGSSYRYMTISGTVRDMGIIYILMKQFESAQQAFKTATEYSKKYLEASPKVSVYSWYGTALSILKNIVLSLDQETAKQISKFPFWQDTPTKIRGKKAGRFDILAESLAALTFGDDETARDLVNLKEYSGNDGFIGGIKATQGILNENVELLKNGVQTLINGYIGESRHVVQYPSYAIDSLATSVLILAVQRKMDLGDWDPKYVPMDYVKLAQPTR